MSMSVDIPKLSPETVFGVGMVATGLVIIGVGLGHVVSNLRLSLNEIFAMETRRDDDNPLRADSINQAEARGRRSRYVGIGYGLLLMGIGAGEVWGGLSILVQ